MNEFIKLIRTAILLGMLFPLTAVWAEDTDIYAANTDALVSPNILVLIDNSSNWAANNQNWPSAPGCPNPCKQGQSELSALRSVSTELTNKINFGMMMFNSGAIDGAYVRWAMRQMTGPNKARFQELIGGGICTDSINTVNFTPNCIFKNFSSGPNNESINAASVDYSAAMFEVYKYFGGYTSPLHASDDIAGSPVDASHFGTLRYSTLPADPKFDKAAYSAAPSWLSYIPPTLNSCSKNYLVFIGNGMPTQDSPATLLTGVGGDATQLLAADFVTVTGNVSTQLGTTAAFATQADCISAAQTTYGSAYTQYSCESAGTSTTTLATSSCGQYQSTAACKTATEALYPGHFSYSCTPAGSCPGPDNLGTTACGKYSLQTTCQTNELALHPGYTSVSCALSALTCTPSTVTLNNPADTINDPFRIGKYATAAACQAAAATIYPGYSSYLCTGAGVSTNLGATACYASAAACTAASAAANPGYSAVSCATPAACTNVRKDVCGTSTSYSTTTTCNSGGATLLPGYARYSCTVSNSAPANWTGPVCSGSTGKYWIILGTNDSYTATGTGTAWTVTGTTTAGLRYDMTGAGGSTFAMNVTDNLWKTFGVRTVTSAIPLDSFTTTSPNNADEWAKFLSETDISSMPGQQNVTTYTIDVFKDAQDVNETKLLMNMARAGGGKYFTATDEDAIKNALRRIFAEIQSVNSVFASSSLPVSVNTQGTYLNQVFMGMFRPNGNATPRWLGNLKQYKFSVIGGLLKLTDKLDAEAISVTTGFIDPCATSFWSIDTGRYWNYAGSSARGACRAKTSNYPFPGSISIFSDSPDGDIVEKGGAALKLRGTSLGGLTSANYLTRNLLTCDGTGVGTCTTFTSFNSTNNSLTNAAFGIASQPASYRNNFLDWIRGQDVDDERSNAKSAEVRPSIHGGVVHSQPAVVDYGGTTGVIAFYGSDDMVFHALDGGQTDAEGNELWGFIAPELYLNFHRQRDNGTSTPLVDFPGVTGSVAPKQYGFDGGIGVYQQSGKVWIFPSMRRGGRAIYGFDVSTPSTPIIKWRKGCFTDNTTDDSRCSTDWAKIGQTWSKPTVSRIKGYSKPVLIFGGGYDTCEDGLSGTSGISVCGSSGSSKGSNIWFVDADTGDIIRIYDTHFSVPGDITTVTDADGFVTQVYVGDTGGYVYRINVGSYSAGIFDGIWSVDISNKFIHAPDSIAIAKLSEAGQPRKFIYGPAVVPYLGFNAVLIGSGDREHPLMEDYPCNNGSGGVTNQYYMLIDKPTAYLTPYTFAPDLTDVTSGSATFSTSGPPTVTNSSGVPSTRGWRFNFAHTCEQAVNKGLVIGGVAYFGTNAPATVATACETDLGKAYGYAVDFLTGNPAQDNAPRYAEYTGGGMPPSPVAGVVDLGGSKQPFCIGCTNPPPPGGSNDCTSALQGCKVDINPSGSRFRSYWYNEAD